MTDLDKAIATAREALQNSHATANERPHWLALEAAMSDLLAALDAARGDVRQKVKDTLTDYLDHYPHPEFLDAVMAHFAPAAPPAAMAEPADNVTPMRQPRADLARLVESINAAVYANGDGLSVTEAIGALELAKLELFKEQEQ